MKARFLSIVLVGMMVLACVTCQQQAGISEQDQAAIRKMCQEAAKMAIGPNADWGAYVNYLYTEDAKVLIPGIPILEGKEAIKAAYSSGGTFQDLTFNTVSIEGRGS
jgi:ketosteroid isomerase-like protein